MSRAALHPSRLRGFTLIELLIGSLVMLAVVVGALQIYSRSNKISADQQQYIEIQTDVRAAMYFMSRDLRMTGTGLSENLMGYAIDGTDNETISGSTETPDRIRLLGNMEDPLVLAIQSYSGSSVDVTMDDYSLEKYPYPDNFYVGKIALIVPNPGSACVGAGVRTISHVTHNANGTNERVNFSPGQAPGINPPGGLSDICTAEDFIGGAMMFCDMREYWLDVTGTVSGLTAGTNGYIGGGVGGVLYLTLNGVHYPLAQNIESIQFQYNGDFNADTQGLLDGFQNWNTDLDPGPDRPDPPGPGPDSRPNADSLRLRRQEHRDAGRPLQAAGRGQYRRRFDQRLAKAVPPGVHGQRPKRVLEPL